MKEKTNYKLPWQFSSEEFKQFNNMTEMNFSYSDEITVCQKQNQGKIRSIFWEFNNKQFNNMTEMKLLYVRSKTKEK